MNWTHGGDKTLRDLLMNKVNCFDIQEAQLSTIQKKLNHQPLVGKGWQMHLTKSSSCAIGPHSAARESQGTLNSMSLSQWTHNIFYNALLKKQFSCSF